jgi:glyoxylase-like metal-dependent hydrolase (beta-lactamase superfamily II)
MKLTVINAGYFKLDGGAMFGVVPKSLWQKANPPDEQNLCTWAMRCLLIESGDRRILIDTGMGDKQDAKFFSYYHPHGPDSLEQGFRQNGYRFEDVTDVLLTHLHFDHGGGALYRAQDGSILPRFPNATYWSNRAHWDAAIQPNERERASFLPENILPLQEGGRLRFVEEAEAGAVLPGIQLRYVHGHTDAMMLAQIQWKDKTLLYCADLIPSVAHIPLAWLMAYDVRPLLTLKEKKQFLQEAVSGKWILFFEHDPAVECCTVRETDRGVRVKETFALNEINALRS